MARVNPISLGQELTDRELEIVRHLMDGVGNKEIARRLDLAEGTVKIYVSHILKKTGASNRTQAVVWAVNKGLNPHTPVKKVA